MAENGETSKVVPATVAPSAWTVALSIQLDESNGEWVPHWHEWFASSQRVLALLFRDHKGEVLTISPTGDVWVREGTDVVEAMKKAFIVYAETVGGLIPKLTGRE